MIAITNDTGLTLDLLPGQNLVTEQAVAWLADDELPGALIKTFYRRLPF